MIIFAQKSIMGLQLKSERHHQIRKFELVEAPSFPLHKRLWIFEPNLLQKGLYAFSNCISQQRG